MKKIIRNKNIGIAVALFFVALIIRIAFFKHPQEFVFDEVYFINLTAHYASGIFPFEQHPPIGKLILYGFSKLFGFNGVPGTPLIGDVFASNAYAYLRLLPILFGSLIPPVVFLLARKLKISLLGATLVGIALVFENSLITESKFVTHDSLLILSGFFGLYTYICSLTSQNPYLLRLISGISLIVAFGTKWTGLAFVGMVALMEMYYLYKSQEKIQRFLTSLLFFCIIPFFIYVSAFALHFKLLPLSGPGDAFMSYEFTNQQLSFTEKFLELNKVMFTANSTMVAIHPYASKWYTWPIMHKGIFYWQSKTDTNQMIYLMGNPFIYWASFVGIIAISLLFVIRRRDKTLMFILTGYYSSLLPFVLIHRPMFLYHYLTSLVFALLALGYLIDLIQESKKKRLVILLSLLFIVSYAYFAPLTYGMSTPHILERFWMGSWR